MKIKRQLVTCGAALVCLGLSSALLADDQNQSQNPSSQGSSSSSGSTIQPGQESSGQSSSDTLDSSSRQQRQYGRQSSDMSDMETTTPGQPTRFNKASKLIGMEVRNDQGEDLGTIKDLVINLESGTVSYAVLSSGGVLGVGEKLLAVPLTAFRRGSDQKNLMLQASKDNIDQAQGIGSNWPSVQHPTFGAMPFWQQGTSRSPSATSTNGTHHKYRPNQP